METEKTISSHSNAAFSRRGFLAGAAMFSLDAAKPSKSRPITRVRTGGDISRFDPERFVADCQHANEESDGQAAVGEILKRAMSDPGAVLSAMGEPVEAGMNVLLRSKTLTIFAAKWTPRMCLVPHDHRMWALIGIYTGREDNIFWRREDGGIKAYEAAALFEGDIAVLPPNAIHSVTNPLLRFTGGLHVYGGDFFDTARTQWDAETLKEEPSDGDVIRAMFARENERFARCV